MEPLSPQSRDLGERPFVISAPVFVLRILVIGCLSTKPSRKAHVKVQQDFADASMATNGRNRRLEICFINGTQSSMISVA
jgi:hypothetical protein